MIKSKMCTGTYCDHPRRLPKYHQVFMKEYKLSMNFTGAYKYRTNRWPKHFTSSEIFILFKISALGFHMR